MFRGSTGSLRGRKACSPQPALCPPTEKRAGAVRGNDPREGALGALKKVTTGNHQERPQRPWEKAVRNLVQQDLINRVFPFWNNNFYLFNGSFQKNKNP